MTKQTVIQTLAATVNTTKAKIAGGAALVMASAAVHAQEAGSAASSAFDTVAEQGTEMSGYAWPVVGAITASLIGIKLFKKFANRAS